MMTGVLLRVTALVLCLGGSASQAVAQAPSPLPDPLTLGDVVRLAG